MKIQERDCLRFAVNVKLKVLNIDKLNVNKDISNSFIACNFLPRVSNWVVSIRLSAFYLILGKDSVR